MVPPASRGIPRGPRYSGYHLGSCTYDYGAVTLYGGPFQAASSWCRTSHGVVPQPQGSKLPRFALFPVRSPLLGESRLISLPPGTEMFQFPGLAPLRVTALADRRVSPFGHPGITACVQLPQAFRSLPRPSSPLDAKASTVCLIAFDLDLVGTTWNYGLDSLTATHPSFDCQRAESM